MNPLSLVLLSLGVSFIPIIIGTMTAYLKVSIVFGMLRTAFGTQHVPNTLVVTIISLAVSFLVMQPAIDEMSARVQSKEIRSIIEKPTEKNIFKLFELFDPLKKFLVMHSGSVEVETVLHIQKKDFKEGEKVEGWGIYLPAFVLTELKESFVMGFLLLLPFLAIDLVVSNILVGLGMTMVSPIIITLPLKLVLFVATDGWLRLLQAMTQSYGVTI